MQRAVIVSDLHLGMGRLPETGRYHRLEAFFFDREFGEFVDWLIADCGEEPTNLILAGDVIDFLRIDAAPGKRGQFTPVEHDGHVHKRGLGFTEAATAWRAQRVADAHSLFFSALARWIQAGHEIIWLPGNHDPELRQPRVQAVLRSAVRRAGECDASRVEEAIHFRPWFHHEVGRLWVEHGNQSDPDNAFAFPLARETPELTCRCFADELDMPIGSWFQRYVYNGLGSVTFQVPSVSAHRPYAYWLLIHRPHALWDLVRSHAPLWRRLIREQCPVDHGPAIEQIQESDEHELQRVAEAASLPLAVLRDLSRAPHEPETARTVVSETVRRTIRTLVVRGAELGLVALLLSFAFVSLLTSSWSTPAKATALLVLFVLLLGATFSGTVVLWVRGRKPDQTRREHARRYAARVAGATGAKTVVLGHYHGEDRWPLPTGGTYVNTGTWVPVWDPGDQLREKVQFTFCDIRGQDPVLRYWDPQADRPRRVILMED